MPQLPRLMSDAASSHLLISSSPMPHVRCLILLASLMLQAQRAPLRARAQDEGLRLVQKILTPPSARSAIWVLRERDWHQRGPRSERRSETTWIATEPEVRGQAAAFWQTKGAVSGAETTPEAAATNAAATIGSSLSFKSASNGPERPPPEEAGRWRGRVPVLWPHVLRAHAAVLGTCQSTRARRPIASKSW